MWSPVLGYTDHGDLTAPFLVWALGPLAALFPSPLYSLSQSAARHSHRVAWLRQGERRFSPVLDGPSAAVPSQCLMEAQGSGGSLNPQ